MKKLFLLLSLTLFIMGCKDDFNIDNLPEASAKMVVYCMPSASDTTYITVSRSIPLKQLNDRKPNPMIDNAHIDYHLNGQALPVTTLGDGRYRVVAHQKTGDKVNLHVEAEGLTSVDASTEIPPVITANSLSVRKVKVKDLSSSELRTYQQVMATFTDPAPSHDYYAVRIKAKVINACIVHCYHRNADNTMHYVQSFASYDDYMHYRDTEHWDSVAVNIAHSAEYLPIATSSERLLNPITDIDDDFDFSSDFYQDFYIFDDATINGQTYTLHLNVAPNYRSIPLSTLAAAELKAKYGIEEGFELEFYHITPAYYRFLQALNDVSNNSLAQAGLSQVRSTYSNIYNGMGICAGFNVTKSSIAKTE